MQRARSRQLDATCFIFFVSLEWLMAQFVVARSLIEIGLDAVTMNEQLCHRALDIHGFHVKLVGVVFMALRFLSNRCWLRSVAIPTTQCAEPCLVSVSRCQISCSAQLSTFQSRPPVSRRHVHVRPSLSSSQEVHLFLLALRSLE